MQHDRCPICNQIVRFEDHPSQPGREVGYCMHNRKKIAVIERDKQTPWVATQPPALAGRKPNRRKSK